ncbi:biotin transporter BioY [candidate division KSB1 bacterium]|nr:biotin transporter BioY [candidate division KSB1 bacterium]
MSSQNEIDIRLLLTSALLTALTAAGAFVKIPFYPVPFTLQTFFTALAGLMLPPRWAALSQAAYLSIGLMGLPVFAYGGGLGYIMQPTFGYLLLLPLSALIISLLKSRAGSITLRKAVIFVSIGMLMVLCGGAIWLYLSFVILLQRDVSFWGTIYSGVVIFLPSMILKAISAGFLWKKLQDARGEKPLF